jgi:hypothetical protein
MKPTSQRQRAVEQVRLELVTRRLSIMVLGFMGVWVGIAMILTGAPSFIEVWFSPWSRIGLGALAFAPGLLVVIGGLAGDNTVCGWWTQILGLWGCAAWYATMTAAYVGLLVHEGAQWATLGQPLSPEISGRGYVPLIYLALFVLAVIPLVTMIRIGRPQR